MIAIRVNAWSWSVWPSLNQTDFSLYEVYMGLNKIFLDFANFVFILDIMLPLIVE